MSLRATGPHRHWLLWVLPIWTVIVLPAAAREADQKLAEGQEHVPFEQLERDRQARELLDRLRRPGDLTTLAAAQRLLIENPDLAALLLATSPSLAADATPPLPAAALHTVVGEGTEDPALHIGEAGVGAHDGLGRQGLLNWRTDGLFSQSAAVLGRNPMGEDTLVGALAASALDTHAGVWGSTDYDEGASYGVYAETGKAEAIPLYALHQGPEDSARGLALLVSGNHKVPDLESPEEHAALIENRASEFPSVLALHMSGETANQLFVTDNFITFFTLNDSGTANVAVGAIEGNGSRGIQLDTAGADIAEYLERLDPDEELLPGDVVGIVAGKVTRNTHRAQRAMVISSGAAVAGNSPGQDKQSNHSLVSFLGQVPVRVQGPVSAGDFIVASGLGDGCGRAVPPQLMTAEDYRMVVGTAWESWPEPGERRINVAVGLGGHQAWAAMQEQFVARLVEKDALLASLERRIEALSRELDRLGEAARLTSAGTPEGAAARR